MGVYVDVDDIKQHFRAGAAVPDETLDEIMQEQESYVQRYLKLDALPPENDILKTVIRDLTIANGIYQITPANADNIVKADAQRRNALRILREVKEEGLGLVNQRPDGNWEKEVYNPIGDDRVFSPADFGIG